MKSIEQIKQARLLTAIKTPFNMNGDVDLATFDTLIKRQIKAGVDGIVVGGTTGEGHLLSWEEHLMLIAHSIKYYSEQLIIIGNTGSNNTREALKATEKAFTLGIDASLQINPYYGRTSYAGVDEHFRRVLALGPSFIYNVPGRTGQDLIPEIIEPLATHENFIGMKECAGNERIAYYEKKGIVCWSGNDDQCHDSVHIHGAHGVISVTSNIVPELMRQLMDNENQGLNQQLQPLMAWLFSEPNPIPLNTALMMTKAVQPVFRLPYKAMTEEQRAQGLMLLKDIGLANIVGESLAPLDEDSIIYSA